MNPDDRQFRFADFVGESMELKQVLASAQKVAAADCCVLLEGETGTGKSALAEAIHHSSARSSNCLIEINCYALPAELLQVELFGDARTGKRGAIEEGSAGTLILDEIHAASEQVQLKLLRFLQSKRFEAVGSTSPRSSNVRIISTTTEDPKPLIENAVFREDLYYRLSPVSLLLPPVRSRVDDIPLLAKHFLKAFAAKSGKTIVGFTAEALQRMKRYQWPGNVRQLENEVHRAVLISDSAEIAARELSFESATNKNPTAQLSNQNPPSELWPGNKRINFFE